MLNSLLCAVPLALAAVVGGANATESTLTAHIEAQLLRLQSVQILLESHIRLDDPIHGIALQAVLSIDGMKLLNQWRSTEGLHSNSSDAVRVLDAWKVRYGALFQAKPSRYEAEFDAISIASPGFLIEMNRASAKAKGTQERASVPADRTKTEADLQFEQTMRQLLHVTAQFQDTITAAQLAALDELERDPRVSSKSRVALRQALAQLSAPPR